MQDELKGAKAGASELLKEALDFTKYAAAAFFPAPFKPGRQKTTAEWWDGLREHIEALQPRLDAAVAAPAQDAKAGAIPAGWTIERVSQGPYVRIDIRSSDGRTARVFRHSVWTGDVLYALAEALLDAPAAQKPDAPTADDFREYLRQIEQTLTIPAAEYVPAIGDVFGIIDEARKAMRDTP